MAEIINGQPSAATTQAHITTDEAATALNTTHRGLVSGNPHIVTAAELGLGTANIVSFTGLNLSGQIAAGGSTAAWWKPINYNTTRAGLHAITFANSNADVDANMMYFSLVNNASSVINFGISCSNNNFQTSNYGQDMGFFESLGSGGFNIRIGHITAANNIFRVKTGVSGNTENLTLLGSGFLGLKETVPETLFEMTYSSPYITTHCDTHSNAAGSGASKWIGKREDGSGTETAAGQIEISHDGAGADDQLGKIILSVNSGAGLATILTLDSGLDATFVGNIAAVDANVTGVYKVDSVQVVGNRVVDARCDDTINSGDGTTDGVIDALRDAMITHGLIAAS